MSRKSKADRRFLNFRVIAAPFSGVYSGQMLFRAACFAILLSASGLTRAEEKYWIAHQADLIVIGTMHPNFTFPWFDGWHLTGTIDVEEVLFGPPQPSRIMYRLVCEYDWCRNWPPPRFDAFFREKGIWFLRPLDRQEWPPSTGVGFAALWARYDFEDYIRRYKETAPRPGIERSLHRTIPSKELPGAVPVSARRKRSREGWPESRTRKRLTEKADKRRPPHELNSSPS